MRLSEAGFTVVEVLVASIMLVTGLLATMGMLNSSNHANNVTERHQVAIGIAQREMEKIDNLDYEELALTSNPQSSADPNSPLNRVNGSQFLSENGQSEEMVIGGESAAVNPGPETVSEGDVSAQVYRFVTWVDAPSYQGCAQNCNSTQDYRRVTVTVQAANDNVKGFDKYVLMSTLKIDPLLGAQGQVTQPSDPNPTEGHDDFFLYDTPNDNCTGSSYVQPSGDHSTHDTSEHCGSTGGKFPDLMGTNSPPNPSEPDLPPLYTYSSDLSGEYTGGLAIQRTGEGEPDCTLSGVTKYQMHSWTTNPLSDSDYELTGKTSFYFWSALVGGTAGNGKICVWLYDRDIVGGNPQDTLIGSSSYTLPDWPGEPTNLSFTYTHSAYTLPAGHRLRFVISVSSQSDSDMQFIYDHPASPSFVQIRTTTPITQ